MKVFFVLAYVLEALGVDFGLARGAITFLMQWVESPHLQHRFSPTLTRSRFHRLPNSRQSESEADRIGIRLMA
jgi:hypothetical protein